MNGEQRPGLFFAHAQDGLNLRNLLVFLGTFSLDEVQRCLDNTLSNVSFSIAVFYNCSVLEEFIGPLTNCTAEAKDGDSGEYGTVNYTVDSKV